MQTRRLLHISAKVVADECKVCCSFRLVISTVQEFTWDTQQVGLPFHILVNTIVSTLHQSGYCSREHTRLVEQSLIK
jgi:hypothetical protein